MKKRMAGIFFALFMLAVASGLRFADSSEELVVQEPLAPGDIKFTAELEFDAAMDNHVGLKLSNQSKQKIKIAKEGYYIDQIGSAGSWTCSTQQDITVKPGKTVYTEFCMDQAVTHGDRSILAFYFKYEDRWYLGKVGKDNGLEYFFSHN